MNWPLLGNEASPAGPPCAISVPNLLTDRGFWVAGVGATGNVRRLMYQSLIWAAVTGDEAGGLRTPLDAEDLQRLADPLIYGMRRNAELGGDLFRRQMLVDQPEAVELARGQTCESRLDRFH